MELTLVPDEVNELETLAADLSEARPRLLDDPAWLMIARRESCHLPRRLRETLRRFRYNPDNDAVLVLRGLPAWEPDLPPTPTVAESVETEATPVAAVLALVALGLGELIAFRGEKHGALVQNVVPVPGKENDQSNVGSTTLKMHVENAFHPHRPDLVALFCVRGDPGRKAALTVASVRNALPLLSPTTRKVLGSPSFITEAPPSFRGHSGFEAEHAVLQGDVDDPDLQVDFCSTRPMDDTARAAMAELADALAGVTQTFALRAGELAIVDNRLTVHGRTAFSPRYDGRDRWLQRAFVQLNYRRSLAMRRDAGCVVD